MIITNFPDQEYFTSYLQDKLFNNFYKLDNYIYNDLFKSASEKTTPKILDLVSNFSTPLDYNDDNPLVVEYKQSIALSQADSQNYHSSYFFPYPPKNLESVFSDLIPPLQNPFHYLFSQYINPFLSSKSYIVFSSGFNSKESLSQSIYDHWSSVSIEELDYPSYFKDIKSIVTKITLENKYYINYITSIQNENINLKRQVDELQQQLNIKSFSTWS